MPDPENPGEVVICDSAMFHFAFFFKPGYLLFLIVETVKESIEVPIQMSVTLRMLSLSQTVPKDPATSTVEKNTASKSEMDVSGICLNGN